MNEMDRLKNAFVPASAEYHHHVAHTLDNMEELTMKRAGRHISAVAIALIIVLIASVALAAAHFGVLDYISHRDDDGNIQVNEEMIPHVQTIARFIEGDTATVTIHDAICDGATLSLAWTIESKLPGEDAFVIWHPMIENGAILLGAGIISQSEFLLEGGATWQGGFSCNLDPMPTDDALHVTLYMDVLAPETEVVSFDGLSDTMSAEEAERYAKEMSEVLADGKIVWEADSFIISSETCQEGETMADALVRLGYMRAVDSFEIPLIVDITSGMTDIQACAEKTTAHYVFEDVSRMESFAKERAALALWPMVDDENQWFGSAETSEPEILSLAEGTWTLRYACNVTNIWRMPETLDIVAHNVINI